jgi:HSP20 family molecular chaperone IbpA
MKNKLKLSLIGIMLSGSTLFATIPTFNFGEFKDNVDHKIGETVDFLFHKDETNIVLEKEENIEKIKIYENKIKLIKEDIDKIKNRNIEIDKEIAKNPKLYEVKKLYEETDDEYIHRIKLNGFKMSNLNFKIKNNHIIVEMEETIEKNDKDGYSLDSKSINQVFTIPKEVIQRNIKHFIDGDYFTIVLPKNDVTLKVD